MSRSLARPSASPPRTSSSVALTKDPMTTSVSIGCTAWPSHVPLTATQAESVHHDAAGYTATLATTDPAGGTIQVRVTPTELTATGPPDADAMAASFARAPGERFLGFGERSDAVVRDAGTVEN